MFVFRHQHHFGGGLLLLCVLLASFGVQAEQKDTAQYLLFDRHYISELSPPAVLHYTYSHWTADEAAWGQNIEDSVTVDIEQPDKGQTRNRVMIEVFSGPKARHIGPISNAGGNPVLMIFLEKDLFAMKRHMQGAPVFMRNAMRHAMRGKEQVTDSEIFYEGQKHPAKTVTVRPYKNQRMPPKYQIFDDKTYRFTVSDVVPGGIFEIESTLPDGSEAGKMQVIDRLTFIKQTNE